MNRRLPQSRPILESNPSIDVVRSATFPPLPPRLPRHCFRDGCQPGQAQSERESVAPTARPGPEAGS
jgi:hypothetical protein